MTPSPGRWRLACLAVLTCATAAAAAEPAPRSRPNILLILADDLGYSDLGCYGGEIRTPNLDALAKSGLRFTQFYNCARCCPSRACLLTGLYPHQAGVGDMTSDRGQPGYRGALQPNTATLAEVLRSAGYRTLMCGKWHLSHGPGRPPTPVDRGFDDYYGLLQGFHGHWDPKAPVRLPAGRPARTYPPGKFYSTDAYTDHALDFLADARKSPGQPFFLYLAYTAPHFPLHAPREDVARYRDTYAKGWDQVRQERFERMRKLGLIDPKWRLSPRSPFETRGDFFRAGANPPWDGLDADRRADLARRMAIYAAMVERMDAGAGRVVADLRAHGQLDGTLILFLSDNGACAEWDPFGFDGRSGPDNVLHRGADLDRMGGPGTYHSYGSGWANACNTPFRWYKHYGHEGGIATPLIAHWPDGIAAKGELRGPVGHLIDVMATFVEVAGARYPAKVSGHDIPPMEGKSLVPAFAGKPVERPLLAWEHERNRAIRAGKWKLVSVHGKPWELYDLEADRTELNDLAARMPERVKELAAQWEQWAKRTNVLPYP
jgi:arylsulfatase